MSNSISFEEIEDRIQAVIALVSSKNGYNYLSSSHQIIKASNKFIKELAFQEKSISQLLKKGKLALEHSRKIKSLIPEDLYPKSYDYWLVWVTYLAVSEDEPANVYTQTLTQIELGIYYIQRLFSILGQGENFYRFFYFLSILEKEYKDFYIKISKGISDISELGFIDFHKLKDFTKKFSSPKILNFISEIKTENLSNLTPSLLSKLNREAGILNEKKKIFSKSLGLIKKISIKTHASYNLGIPPKGKVQLSSFHGKRLDETFGENASIIIETFLNSNKITNLDEIGKVLKVDTDETNKVINRMRNNADHLIKIILG
jgi:hypothetical protein